MQKIINDFFSIVKFFANYPKIKLRILIFDYKTFVSKFSMEKVSIQKKLLINLIKKENFLLLENFIKNKKTEKLEVLLKNITKLKTKKITFIYIYSYLVNINEYRLAVIYHNLLCKTIDQNSFFYFQICTLNQNNISKFELYTRTLEFKLIYFFLLDKDEKNYVKTILNIDKNSKLISHSFNQKDFEYKENLINKKVKIIGPLNKKCNLKKKDLKNSFIIRMKNTNFLKDKDFNPHATYLNGTASRQYFKKKNYLLLNKNLIWVVYINKSFYKTYKKDNNLKNRFASNNNSTFFTCFTELNLLQKMLLDLILFNPKEIKLLNFNLYLSKKTRFGYRTTKLMTFNHNQIVMFDFINFLYKKRKILLENDLKNIVTRGKDNYLKKLEQTWKN